MIFPIELTRYEESNANVSSPAERVLGKQTCPAPFLWGCSHLGWQSCLGTFMGNFTPGVTLVISQGGLEDPSTHPYQII